MGRQPNFGTPIAFGLILAALVIGYFDYSSSSNEKTSQRKISVKGSASEQVKADHAVWNGRTVNESSALSRLHRMAQKDREVLGTFVQEQGFDSTRIEFLPPQLQREGSGRGTRYTLIQPFRLSGDEVKRIRSCARAAPSLMERGVSVQSDHPRFRYRGLQELRNKLLQEAVAQARKKAEGAADSSDVTIVGLQGVEENELKMSGKAPEQGVGPREHVMSSLKGTVELGVDASFSIE